MSYCNEIYDFTEEADNLMKFIFEELSEFLTVKGYQKYGYAEEKNRFNVVYIFFKENKFDLRNGDEI